jgi:DNA mismatch repair protein MutS2
VILPPSFENKLGFDRIRHMIVEQCLCELGKKRVHALSFETSIKKVRHELELTDDIRKILLFEEHFPQEDYLDITECLKKIKVVGSYPEVHEVNDFRKSINTIRELERFFSGTDIKEKYPIIVAEFSNLKYFPSIGKRIDSILSSQGLIKDNASAELKTLREQIKQKQITVTRRIQSILRTAQQEGIVEVDAEITLRNGRPVIPVVASNKRKLGGLVHDESSTGKTVFIEPGAVVELNNELRELEYAERREIIKILTTFADDIRPYLEDLFQAYNTLGQLDFLRAKAKVALRINAVKPILKDDYTLSWKKAVHPLLFLAHASEGKEVIPLDLQLDSHKHILLISGPNAGGKSVCLKTVGLLQYMVQCGMLIPMSENSEVCVFQNIFIDIGDEQSLENDLSTYSSHLLNMKQFLRQANDKTLILIDEFGTGTEPALGGAIAEAILEEFVRKGAFGVITTHYANLKHLASETPGMVNGAMLFDTQQIRPLFILSIGKPGSSFAIDIARNIGLPEEILKSASAKVGADYINFEKHLREIIRDKKYLEDKRHRIRNVERTLDDLYENYSAELEEIQKERKKILSEARLQAQEILRETNKQVERTIREIKEHSADKEKTREAREQLESYKESLKNGTGAEDKFDKKMIELEHAGNRLAKHSADIHHSKVNERIKKEKENVGKAVSLGDQVRMKGFDSIGEVVEVNEKSVVVAFGNMITTTEHSKLEIVKGRKDIKRPENRVSITNDLSERKLSFKAEIDVRGKRAEEALEIVQEFIDDALIAGVRNLQILHGKGNGILRQLIRDYLKTLNVIKKASDAHADRGGAGITLVELKI